ncbi:EpsG family protein [Aliivibrio fischeri]|uniref:EpsG family protein n=1 Tax=Aliivibrio fischeri TaxID=668 RepID=UPI0012D97B28|nr:EpsG family protein [Aliivibrio fischeri]
MKAKLLFQVLINLLVCSFLILFSFRETGLDYKAYMMEFYDPINNSVSSEFGYKILIKIINPFVDFWFLLLICNIIFYLSHRKIINNLYNPLQIFVFFIYFINLSVFLILGSPRRLVANSIVVYIIYNEFSKGANNKNYFLAIIASLFHTSAVVIVPIIYFLRHRISQWFSISIIFKLILGGVISFLMLHFTGILNLIFIKIDYYLIHSLKEQEYLSEVPSVMLGFVKRFVSLFLVWLAIRRWDNNQFVLKLGTVEVILYTVLGYFNPVLAVVATYLSICYLLPFTMPEFRKCNNSTKTILMLSVWIYFVPTIIGLIRMFGNMYV